MQALVRLTWNLLCSVFVQYAISVYEEIGFLKKHGRHQPIKFEHLLNKINGGWSEWNSMGMFDSWP